MITRKLKNLYLILLCFAVPLMAQSVTVTVGDATVDGYTSDIEVPVILTNPNDAVAGIQFDMEVAPGNVISLTSIDAVGDASGFSASFNELSDDVYRVVLYNAGSTVISANADTVMTLHFDGSSVVSSQVDLLVSGLIVSDSAGGTISSSSGNGSITIGYVVSLDLSDGQGDINETVSVTVDMNNGGVVGGVQFDLFDTPDYVTISNITTTTRTDGFTVTTSDIGSGTRVLVYDAAGSDISAGTGPILNVDFTIHSNAYAGDVAVFFSEVVVSDDIGGVYWIADLDTGFVTVFPGYMEEPHNLIAISGLDGEIPLSWDSPVGPIPPTVPFTIEILTDGWPTETSWDLVHVDADTVVGSITAGELTSTNTLYTWDFELASGGYIFTIYDTFGDGICCGYGEGYYSLILDGNEIASGGEFGASESVTFNTSDGRYNIVQYNYVAQLQSEKEIDTYITREDFTINTPIFIERGLFETPYLNDVNIDARESERDVPVSGYNLYRSTDGATYDMIASVGSDELTYTDDDVINGLLHYYYVTTDYSPDGTESGPSNIADATPVEWVELSISSGAALSGTIDTLELFINNESEISQFFFEIEDTPDYLEAQSFEIFETDRTSGWYLSNEEVGGKMQIVGSSVLTGANPIPAGDGAVCKVIVMAVSQDPTVCDLMYTTSTNVKDANGNDMNWTADDATFDVSVETQFLVMPSAYGEPGDEITIPLLFKNTQDVYLIQVYLTDVPNYVSGVYVTPTAYVDFITWNVSGINSGNEFQILLFDNPPFNNPIPAGTGHIADINFSINSNAPSGEYVELSMGEVLVLDQNNNPIHTEYYESSIYVGTPEAIYSIGEINQASQTITIELENTIPFNILELDLADVPDGIEVTSVNTTGRFNGLIDGQSGEKDNGMGYILAYDLANGISVGTGPILEISYNVLMDTGLYGDVLAWLSNVNSTYSNGNAILSIGTGFAVLDANLSVENDLEIPNTFALHPAFPNPFNPMTNIRYDLSEAGFVDLRVYDLAGREVRTLAKGFDQAGEKSVVWNAKDNHGRSVSAGVYIYRLETAGQVQSQKMILLK
jgi:hypothetical protein